MSEVRTSKYSGEEGMALIWTLLLLVLSLLSSLTYLHIVTVLSDQQNQRLREMQMEYKAEDALSKAVAEVRYKKNSELKKSDRYWNGTIISSEITDELKAHYQVNDKEKKAESKREKIQTSVFFDSTESEDTLFTIDAQVKPILASDYFMIFDSLGEPYFLSGDIIDGKIHSNSTIKTAGKPFFTDTIECYVSKSFGIDRYLGYAGVPILTVPIFWDTPRFLIEELDAEIRETPDRLFSSKNLVSAVKIDGDRLSIRHRDPNIPGVYSAAQSLSVSSVSSIYFNQDVEVQGTLRGQLTIGSRGSIYITDDLVYEDSDKKTGQPSEEDESVLGLIAAEDVLISKDPHKAKYDYGIKVNAAIIALNNSMKTKNLLKKEMKNLGTFHFWGSITEKKRGSNAYSVNGNILYGYQKDWHYDRRFRDIIPPKFAPIKDENGMIQYSVTSWKRRY